MGDTYGWDKEALRRLKINKDSFLSHPFSDRGLKSDLVELRAVHEGWCNLDKRATV